MRLRKTAMSNRTTYTYHFENGDKVILEPGKSTTIYASGGRTVVIDESISEVTITNLHREDDAEVRSNLKYINCETRAEQDIRIKLKKQWDEAHRDENGFVHGDNPYEHAKRNVSFDYFCTEDSDDNIASDKSKLEYKAIIYNDIEEIDSFLEERKLIREFVTTLPKSMQELYKLLYIEGLSQAEVCKKLNLSKSTVSERTKTLYKKIYEHFNKPELSAD